MIIVYPILIAVTRVSVIWVKNKLDRQLLMSATHVIVVVAIVHVNNVNQKKYDKPENR